MAYGVLKSEIAGAIGCKFCYFGKPDSCREFVFKTSYPIAFVFVSDVKHAVFYGSGNAVNQFITAGNFYFKIMTGINFNIYVVACFYSVEVRFISVFSNIMPRSFEAIEHVVFVATAQKNTHYWNKFTNVCHKPE